MSYKTRIGLLAAATVALALWWWLGGRTPEVAQQRTFRAHLVQVDTATLNAFTIIPAPVRQRPALHFRRGETGWSVQADSFSTDAFQRPLNQLLAVLADVRPVAMPGHDPGTIRRYQLGDSLADRLLLPGNEVLRIGSATAGHEPATAMMLEGDPNAYLVPGTVNKVVEMTLTDWIPKPLVNGDPANWEKLTFLFPGGKTYTLERVPEGWTVGGMPADSSKVHKFLWAMSRYYGNALADPADTLNAVPAYRMQVEDRTRAHPILLVIYATEHGLIARSSLAPRWLVMPFDPQVELRRMFRPPEAFL